MKPLCLRSDIFWCITAVTSEPVDNKGVVTEPFSTNLTVLNKTLKLKELRHSEENRDGSHKESYIQVTLFASGAGLFVAGAMFLVMQ